MKKTLFIAFALLLSVLFTGCREDTPVQPGEALVTFEVKSPLGIEGQLTNLRGEIVSKAKGTKQSLTFEQNKARVTLSQGTSYTLHLIGDFATKGVLTTLEYSEDLVTKSEQSYTHTCQLTFVMPKESFVISEIFFAGTLNKNGEQYDEDKFIRITNNSPVTRYADGLALVRSTFQSDDKKEQIQPDVRSTHMPVSLVMQIPGDGTTYPVKPYESIILCHSAINHAQANPNSIDLSGANFEWMSEKGYTDSETPDNPQVPDMRLIFISDPYGDGVQNWAMSTNGQHTYALVDLQGLTAEELAKKYSYPYEEVMIIEGMDPMKMPGEPALQIPNEWVLDAVNLSMKNDFQWLPVSEKLDAGYASVAPALGDDSRYGKKVVRKPLNETSKVLQDTNNSSEDFRAVNLK
ncbi:DUF4876 domain-containing protein [Porphyromonas bennonis]|uniref:DUF4876 domain-containing protein n=1 Tax=Porphyromonas bennonis TaxID=501496 RepID=UPI000370EA00|nr:DUF4876 domain-containing protein [Porphyromonas bennonis]